MILHIINGPVCYDAGKISKFPVIFFQFFKRYDSLALVMDINWPYFWKTPARLAI